MNKKDIAIIKIKRAYMNKKVYNCYIPKILSNFLNDDFLEKDIPIPKIMEIADSLVEADSINFFSRRILIKLVMDATEKDIETTHINLRYLGYEAKTKKIYPFFGDVEKPFLIVDKKDKITFDDYDYLAKERANYNFTIIESKEFNDLLLEDYICEKELRQVNL